MPKAFSEREKDLIRTSLLKKGRECISTYGVKKTSVDDLTRLAGISKGAFYLFYDSKEELFLDVLEQFEQEYRQEILARLLQPGKTPRQSFTETLQYAARQWKHNPLFQQFGSPDLDYLMRKLPPEKAAAHLNSDTDFSADLFARLNAAGARIQADPRQATALIRSLFLVSLHESDFSDQPGLPQTEGGDSLFESTLQILVELVVDYIFGKTA